MNTIEYIEDAVAAQLINHDACDPDYPRGCLYLEDFSGIRAWFAKRIVLTMTAVNFARFIAAIEEEFSIHFDDGEALDKMTVCEFVLRIDGMQYRQVATPMRIA